MNLLNESFIFIISATVVVILHIQCSGIIERRTQCRAYRDTHVIFCLMINRVIYMFYNGAMVRIVDIGGCAVFNHWKGSVLLH